MTFILVVDDQEINREFLVTLLSYSNYQIQEAINGQDAIEKMQLEQPILVITDLFMPKMNGYELAQNMRNHPDFKNIPVIFYTATYRMEEAQLLADSCNVKWVLTKPAEPEVILETVNKALGADQMLQFKQLSVSDEIINEEKLDNIKKCQKRINFSQQLSQYIEKTKFIKHWLDSFMDNKIDNREKITEPFLANVNQLYQFNSQLFSLTTLNLDLISEKDQTKLIRLFCEGAQSILKTKYCGFFLLNSQGEFTDYFLIDEKNNFCELNKNKIEKSIVSELIESHALLKISDINAADVTLPKNHPIVKSFLGTPLYTTSRTYGGLYFSDKLNDSPFIKEDEFIVLMLAAEIAVLLENIDLYTIIQRHAATLQVEISERKGAEIDLRKSEKLFRQFAENINDVFWQISPNLDKIFYVSPAYEEIWQKSRDELYNNPLAWLEAVVDNDKPKVKDIFLSNTENLSTEFRIKRPDGTMRKLYAKGALIRDKHGKIESKIGIATDITDFEKSQTRNAIQTEIPKIFSKADSFNKVSSNLLEIICKTLHFALGEIWLLNNKTSELYCMASWTTKRDKIQPLIDERLKIAYPIGEGLPGLVCQTKSSKWISDQSKLKKLIVINNVDIQTVFGVPIIFQNTVIGVMQFFSEEKLEKDAPLLTLFENIGAQLGEFISYIDTSEQLSYLARHNSLTGFLNRFAWEEELDSLITNSSYDLIAIYLFEIDRFKLIIDAIGHDGADDLLRLIAKKIQLELVLPEDLLASLSIDKFAIALIHVKSIEQVNYFASRLISMFKAPFFIKGKEIFITFSIGGSLYPQNGENSKSLLMNAELALDRTKEQGGNCYNLFTYKKNKSILNKLDLENELRQALQLGQFVLYYQPQIDLKLNIITGFEALIRWQHPERGLLQPSEFLLTLEESDLIAPVGEWVLREACHQINQHNLPIAVNISVYQFRARYNLVGYIRQLIKETGINPSLLDLEITERLMMHDISNSFESLEALRMLNVRFSLDDFGTGYCSLNYLKHFSVDKVKIDKSFIDGLPHDQNNKAIVSAILALSHGLGIKVIAEGVESNEQLKFLLDMGCDEIQGYYYSKPFHSSEIDAFIKSQKKLVI